MPTNARPIPVLALAPLALMLTAGPVCAQYQLGDGLGLQMDVGQMGTVGRTTYTNRDAWRDSLAYRNAIVTGQAANGMAFRGDLGYSAPFEFRDALGSNDLYEFRRDSYYSGLAGEGIRGTDAIQYQFALTTGKAPPKMLGPGAELPYADAIRRSGSGYSSRFLQDRAGPRQVTPIGDGSVAPRDRYQPEETDPGLVVDLRSASVYTANRALRPELVSYRGTETGYLGITASPLRGIRAQEFVDPEKLRRANAGLFGAQLDGQDNPGDQPDNPNRIVPDQPDDRVPVQTAYDQLVLRMTETATTRAEYEQPQTDPLNPNADPDANPEDTLPDWQRRLLELREELQVLEEQQALGIDPSAPSQATGSATGAAPGAPSPTGVTLPEGFELPDPMQRRGGRANEPGDTLIPRREAYRLDPSTLQLIRDSGDTVETFIPSGGGVRNPYAEHMAAGQRLMQAGRYFDAEERFTTAVSVREDDPMAQIGRVHAQLGAAMFLSAGVNLRTYLLQRPEAAGLRYDAPLLPLPERQAVLAELLLEKSDANASIAREASLLLTYMGYQARNDEWLSRGLERMQQHWDGEPILDFVTGVWGLTPPVPQSDPQPE